MSVAMNTYRDHWLKAVIGDPAVSSGSYLVASAIACAMGVRYVATTDWQTLNTSLGRARTNPAVRASITELQSAGYLERDLGDGRAFTQGWRLTQPGKEQE
ncbi:hypothetical protein NG701_04965 [Pseudarthrobacter sp. HLT3-5]|uniref:hypothetical protein n=1 Tax=Pseudarthrobacter cellobiosi TaxID=2953654 RepID=UPI00208F2D34|nr:hypothetical protein [Pseudarthrobacter sp. HLT3-5]MCO4273785.1 hypothetical protein [Pseudarthrobacter sp. HLT3-5]